MSPEVFTTEDGKEAVARVKEITKKAKFGFWDKMKFSGKDETPESTAEKRNRMVKEKLDLVKKDIEAAKKEIQENMAKLTNNEATTDPGYREQMKILSTILEITLAELNNAIEKYELQTRGSVETTLRNIAFIASEATLIADSDSQQ